jgi:hypothetical protein
MAKLIKGSLSFCPVRVRTKPLSDLGDKWYIFLQSYWTFKESEMDLKWQLPEQSVSQIHEHY